MGKVSIKISEEQKKIFQEIINLRRLPKSEERDNQIQLKKIEYKTQNSQNRVLIGEIEYQSFESTFRDGEKAVIVYTQQYNDINIWSPLFLFTWMTDNEANTYFDVNEMGYVAVTGKNIGFSDWISNDDGTSFEPDFDILENQTLLGIQGAKGYFFLFFGLGFGTPSEQLQGQTFQIIDRISNLLPGPTPVLVDTVTFIGGNSGTSSSSLTWMWGVVFVFATIFVILKYTGVLNVQIRKKF